MSQIPNVVYLFQQADGRNNKPERRVHGPAFGEVHLLSTDEQRNLTQRAFFPGDTAVQQFLSPTVALSEICYISYGLRPSSKKDAKEKFVTADLVSEEQE